MRRVLIWLLLTPVFLALAVIGVRMARAPLTGPPPADQTAAGTLNATPLPTFVAPQPRETPPDPAAEAAACAEGPADAAAANTTSLTAAAWSAFGRAETGWEIYAPRAAAEIGAPACAPTSPGFAAALARWQGSRGLGKSGVMDEPTLAAMKNAWAMQRPFVLVNKKGVCPDAPPEVALDTTTAADTYGSPLKLRAGALAAWRRLMSDARAEVPAIAADPNLLKIMSGYRDPVADAVRCATEMNCQNITRSTCSAHRTGLAVDVYLGSAPGFDPASSEDVNRLFQSRGPAYRWLVANAGRYGFVNYAFEPWHWEWTGEPVVWEATN